MNDLASIKAGDRAWVGSHYGERNSGIRQVKKVTPTQIVIDWNNNGGSYVVRFKRDSGYEIAGGWFPKRITGIATKSECAKFDAEQLAAKLAREAKDKVEAARAALRTELEALFDTPVNISVDRNQDDTFRLEFCDLTADRIREIAKILKERV
jgi:hypothetical protein